MFFFQIVPVPLKVSQGKKETGQTKSFTKWDKEYSSSRKTQDCNLPYKNEAAVLQSLIIAKAPGWCQPSFSRKFSNDVGLIGL